MTVYRARRYAYAVIGSLEARDSPLIYALRNNGDPRWAKCY